MKTNSVQVFYLFINVYVHFEDIDRNIRLKQCVTSHIIDLFFTTHVIKFSNLALPGIPPQVIQSKHNFFIKIKK